MMRLLSISPLTTPPLTMAMLLGLGSGFMLGMAYFFEYGLGLAPCTMCYWQRVPHGVVIALGLISAMPFLPKSKQIALAILAAGMVSLLVGAGLAAWHSGVELKILPGPSACSGGVALDGSPAALLDQLLAAPVVRCDEVPWSLFGLSMANWNSIITASMAVAAGIILARAFKTKS